MSFKLVEKKNQDLEQNFVSHKDFFRKIDNDADNSSPIKYDMDSFILCLLIGLKEDKRENTKEYKFYQTFATNYIDSYIKVKPLITGLLISKIMTQNNIDKNEKDKIKKCLQEFLNTNESSDLSSKSFELMHEYYLGGYLVLLKKFNFKIPDEISVFFDKYNRLLSN